MHASAGWYGDHTVDATSDGVTVRKGLDLDTLALPALKFEIRSDRDDPVGVRVVDQLPATVDSSRVGVHADFAADQWTAFEDGRVTFTTRLDPERPVVTLYGIWLDDPSRVHELLGRPQVKVASDPDAPSLSPVGDAVALPTVDDSLRSVGPDALAELRSDVEEALTGARAEPADPATALPAPGVGDDADGDAEPTMGDHAWTYPVERLGTGRIAAPTHADLDSLVDQDPGEEHVYLRAALEETHHGGGGALLLQELANAFEVVARRITGDDERATVDAVVTTPLGTDAVLAALADRDQVTDALVSPLVGDRDDATGIDAEPDGETATAERDGTEEVSIEPDSEDVEVVLNADGERFSELKSEFEHETDTDALEDELADLELPGVDTSEEPTIDELVDGDEFADADDDGFVPASVEGADDLSFDGEAADVTELNFAADNAFEPSTDESADEDVDAPTGGRQPDSEGDAAAADGTDPSTGGATGSSEAVDDTSFEFDVDTEPNADEDADAGSGVPEDPAVADGARPAADPLAAEDDAETWSVDDESDARLVEVPAAELAAVRTEMRELRDRVAALESDLVSVRQELARERRRDSTATVPDPPESIEAVEGGDDVD